MPVAYYNGKPLAGGGTTIKGPISKAEYDAMPGEQKSGWYLVTGDDSGGNSEEIYSDEEVRIGTFYGKPLYRSTRMVTTGTTIENITNIWNVASLNIEKLIAIKGIVYVNSGNMYSCPYYVDDEENIYIYYNDAIKNIREKHGYTKFNSCEILVIIEYTKTTDSAAIDAARSTVELPAYELASASDAKEAL